MAILTRQREVFSKADNFVTEAQATICPNPILEQLKTDPSLIMSLAGMTPDPWQTRLLTSSCKRMLLLCSRQAGKTTTAAGLAIREAILNPNSLILLLSPTLRQSGEILRAKVLPMYRIMGAPISATSTTALTLTLANGSRIVSLPENEEGIRGFSGVNLIVIDEASRVSDQLYRAVRPMLAVSKGRLIALSTPFGKRGWFFEEWEGKSEWERVRITATDCPRIERSFLLEEYRSLGERWWNQEYYCSFEDAIDAVFSYADVQAALQNPHGFKPLFADDYEDEDDDEGEIPSALLADRNPRLDD